MDVAFFSTRAHDRASFSEANAAHRHDLEFLEPRLTAATSILAAGAPAVCVFVNDDVGVQVLEGLAAQGTRLVALRSTGFNHVDLNAAHRLGITVVRVPSYSPFSVAEHTVGLILSLTRHIHRAYARVRDGNFALDGLLGFDLHERTVGVVGTGRIGVQVVRIMRGFGCRVLTSDPVRNAECEAMGAVPVPFEVVLAESDIITLHCPLVPETHHLIDGQAFGRMRRGVMLINTSQRGDCGAQDRHPRASRPRRLRRRGGSVLSGSLGGGDPRRRVRAAADVSERADHGASGFLHEGSGPEYRRDDPGKHHGLRAAATARKRGDPRARAKPGGTGGRSGP
jgi:D-lactate dehydrogenase